MNTDNCIEAIPDEGSSSSPLPGMTTANFPLMQKELAEERGKRLLAEKEAAQATGCSGPGSCCGHRH
jgi:hypothetical protein